ncbi:MAG: hypothetical protein KGJ52_04430 [Gammaproteobacteria bacterium]|nr:hypothetical protein [Gammaproteobacteria bacterium]
MNTHKTFSLLAAVLIVAAQATVFAVDTRSTTQSQARDRYENGYEAQAAGASAVNGTSRNA